ncbi:MAG TPA: hypothetical protein VLE53_10210 [Gemmatimonadaceae bacterium]|nr:hypothetical protein [Gemmatimonadaceae bacterium]
MTPGHVVFVCEHGAAKSVLAAIEFNWLAEARGAAIRAMARGAAPDPAIAPVVVERLASEGVHLREPPKAFASSELRGAVCVVTFDQPQVAAKIPNEVPIETWDGLPAVSDGFDAAREAIRSRVRELLDQLVHGEASGGTR